MKLVYKDTGKPVTLGDIVELSDGEKAKVTYFREPHKPASSGKVTVRHINSDDPYEMEYYVSVISALWIEREDHGLG